MYNIKQRFTKFITSFICIIGLSACQTVSTKNTKTIEKIIDSNNKVEIAILMPLSGEKAAEGTEYTKLIKMGVEDGLQGKINLTIYDGANETLALTAMKKIIAANTKIILGPLTSPITSCIAEQAKAAGIIVITLSNNPILADEKLLVFGHAPVKQLLFLTDFFLQKKYKNFITLLPEGSHSNNTSKILQNLIVKNQGMLIKAEFYRSSENSINHAIKLIDNSVSNLIEVDPNNYLPIIIVGGDDTNILTTIFNSIKAYNLDKKAIIAGDNKLDFYYSDNINIVFSGSLNTLNANLKNKAMKENIYHITFMHALAYDIGKMTATFVGQKFNEGDFLNCLKSGYVGTSGNIKFVDGIATRGYDIIKRTSKDYEIFMAQ